MGELYAFLKDEEWIPYEELLCNPDFARMPCDTVLGIKDKRIVGVYKGKPYIVDQYGKYAKPHPEYPP